MRGLGAFQTYGTPIADMEAEAQDRALRFATGLAAVRRQNAQDARQATMDAREAAEYDRRQKILEIKNTSRSLDEFEQRAGQYMTPQEQLEFSSALRTYKEKQAAAEREAKAREQMPLVARRLFAPKGAENYTTEEAPGRVGADIWSDYGESVPSPAAERFVADNEDRQAMADAFSLLSEQGDVRTADLLRAAQQLDVDERDRAKAERLERRDDATNRRIFEQKQMDLAEKQRDREAALALEKQKEADRDRREAEREDRRDARLEKQLAARTGGQDIGVSTESLGKDNVLRRQAVQYLLTGSFPRNTGRGGMGAAQNARIRQAGDTLAESLGVSPGEVEAIRAEYTANTKSLQGLTKGMDSVSAFEQNAQGSLDLIERLAENMRRGKYPRINRISQAIRYETGDPDIKAFRNAITTAMTEYMKVTTAGQGISVQQLHQGAQERADAMVTAADNPQAFARELSVYRQEMAIKDHAFKNKVQEIRNRIVDLEKPFVAGMYGKGEQAGQARQFTAQQQADYDDFKKAWDSAPQRIKDPEKLKAFRSRLADEARKDGLIR